MGLLFSRLWSRLSGSKPYKVCIVGLDAAGKTTTLYKLHLGEVVATKPTIGSNVEEITHKNIKIQAWDLGGQEQLRTTWHAYFTNTDALIMVVDSTDTARIDLCRQELFRCLSLDALDGVIVLIYANKQDCENAMTTADMSIHLDLVALRGRNWHIQACCALTGNGLYEGIDWVVDQLRSK